jgi:hypothetical protein
MIIPAPLLKGRDNYLGDGTPCRHFSSIPIRDGILNSFLLRISELLLRTAEWFFEVWSASSPVPSIPC